MHQFLATVPFDLYELALFQLVVKHAGFTKAAELAGLTQSAITRQIQGIEAGLGVKLLERTTRQVRLTPAGAYLYREAARLLGDVEQTIDRLAQEYAGARKVIRVGVSRTISLSYLPGFFHANIRQLPQVGYNVTHQQSQEIVSALEANEQDVGLFCRDRRLPVTLRVTHRFTDAFTLIAPIAASSELQSIRKLDSRLDWLKRQNWLLVDEQSNTGGQLRPWMRRIGLRVEPMMQLDNFDLIINLVALGMGVSFVPIRALALYNQRHKVARVALPTKFTREVVVVVRKSRELPQHLEQFIENILF
jgi:DNA-binding transcriptional LysR family regulator